MKTEKTFWAIFIVAIILRLFNIPGHGLLTVLTLGVLGVLYFPVGFYFFCDKQIKRQNIALSIVSGFFLSYVPIGILFKLQHYPGQKIMMIVGLISGLTFLIVTYFLLRRTSEDLRTYYKNMFLRTLVLAITVTFFAFFPTKVITQIQYRDDPQRVILLNKIEDDPDNMQYREDLREYLNQKDSIKFSTDKK